MIEKRGQMIRPLDNLGENRKKKLARWGCNTGKEAARRLPSFSGVGESERSLWFETISSGLTSPLGATDEEG